MPGQEPDTAARPAAIPEEAAEPLGCRLRGAGPAHHHTRPEHPPQHPVRHLVDTEVLLGRAGEEGRVVRLVPHVPLDLAPPQRLGGGTHQPGPGGEVTPGRPAPVPAVARLAPEVAEHELVARSEPCHTPGRGLRRGTLRHSRGRSGRSTSSGGDVSESECRNPLIEAAGLGAAPRSAAARTSTGGRGAGAVAVGGGAGAGRGSSWSGDPSSEEHEGEQHGGRDHRGEDQRAPADASHPRKHDRPLRGTPEASNFGGLGITSRRRKR